MTGPKHKADAAIVSLICLLPPEITQLWWDTATLSGCLRRGGVTGITPARLRKALFMTQRLTPATPWKCRLWEKTLDSTCLAIRWKMLLFLYTRHRLPTFGNNYFLQNTRASGEFLYDIQNIANQFNFLVNSCHAVMMEGLLTMVAMTCSIN